jgi:hypothetical protein
LSTTISPPVVVRASAAWKLAQGDDAVQGLLSLPNADTYVRRIPALAACEAAAKSGTVMIARSIDIFVIRVVLFIAAMADRHSFAAYEVMIAPTYHGNLVFDA